MLHQSCIPAYAHGKVRVGASVETAEPLWIEPYRSLSIASTVEGTVDVHASFDGVRYYERTVNLSLGSVVYPMSGVAAAWLKFLPGGDAPIPANTLIDWGAQS